MDGADAGDFVSELSKQGFILALEGELLVDFCNGREGYPKCGRDGCQEPRCCCYFFRRTRPFEETGCVAQGLEQLRT